MGFRVKKSIPLSADRQGYVYFRSRMYRELGERRQSVIRALCRDAGGEYASAVLEFVTSDAGATAICMRHHLSRETLDRAVRKYYLNFPKNL